MKEAEKENNNQANSNVPTKEELLNEKPDG